MWYEHVDFSAKITLLSASLSLSAVAVVVAAACPSTTCTNEINIMKSRSLFHLGMR